MLTQLVFLLAACLVFAAPLQAATPGSPGPLPSLKVQDYPSKLQSRQPRFQDYPVRVERTAQAAPPHARHPVEVILDTPELRNYRTRLRAAAGKAPDFAGDHVLARWGCGTSCVHGGVVNVHTGRAVMLPGSVCCNGDEEERLQYRPDSRLLILYGRVNEGKQYGRHFYEFTGRGFRHLFTLPMENTYLKDFLPRLGAELEVAEAMMRRQEARERALCPPARVCGWVGMNLFDLTPEHRRVYHVPPAVRAGALALYLMPENPALRDGLKVNDIVTAIDGVAVRNAADTDRLILALRPGVPARFSVLRQGRPLTLAVTAARRPPWPCVHLAGRMGPPHCAAN